MKILIAPDSFRGSLSSSEVAGNLKKGILKFLPDALITIIPMADGGEGTVEAIVTSTNGKRINVRVYDPLMREIDSFFGITGDGKTAVIEMASASGNELLKADEKNPWITTTYGTGQLIKAALDQGCDRIVIGIGGSATNDGGAGMASSLGVKFFDVNRHIVEGEGGKLMEIDTIDISHLDKRLSSVKIFVACDVTNPLTGPDGAAFVFGPQKGADLEMVRKLDANLRHFSGLIKSTLSIDVEYMPGAGAAGGLGAGLVAFLNARLVKGFEIISGIINLEKYIAESDIVITGEGKIDFQTQFGKTVFGIAQLSKKYHKPVIAVAGTVEDESDVLYHKGLDAIIPIIDRPVNLEYAMKHAPVLLEKTGERIARLISLGMNLKSE